MSRAVPSLVAEHLSEITADMSSVTPEQGARVFAAVERHAYTATALAALAKHYRDELDDAAGADLLDRFAREFAAHEAATV